jgi:hypothetical protein
MGLFSPYVYKNKKGEKFWLHVKDTGKARLFYFSKNPEGALFSLPPGYEVVENKTTGLPFLRRKTGGFLFFKPKEKPTEEAEKSS